MKEVDIQSGNQLIAEFMPDMVWNIPKNVTYPPYWRKVDDEGLPVKDYVSGVTLQYHRSWNDLMPVVVKINRMERYHFIIYGSVAEVYDEVDNECITKCFTTEQEPQIIEAVWRTIVQFIEWYNEHK